MRTVPTALQRDSGFTNFSDLISLQSGTLTELRAGHSENDLEEMFFKLVAAPAEFL